MRGIGALTAAITWEEVLVRALETARRWVRESGLAVSGSVRVVPDRVPVGSCLECSLALGILLLAHCVALRAGGLEMRLAIATCMPKDI